MIKGLNHVGISVSDLQRSVEFYRKVFGLEVTVERRFEGEIYEKMLGLGGTAGRVALLVGNQMRIELFEFTQPSPKAGDIQRPVCDHGITHFCVEVSDIQAEYLRMTAAGALFHTAPLDFSGLALATYGRDPDGNVFELWERGAAP
jgi:catechol 2,3-dioxygenase-like lactoylglutathione lyase family enzyme